MPIFAPFSTLFQTQYFGAIRLPIAVCIFEDFVEYEKLGMLKYVKDRYTVQLAMKTFAVVLAKSCSREHS